MATNENGTSDTPRHRDLDRLIGELETEAARRRAEPGYPHDADARLHFELARRAPHPAPSADLRALVAQVEDVASLETGSPADPGTASTGGRRHDRQMVHRHLERADSRITSLSLATGAAFQAITGRLEQLEAQVRNLTPPPDDAAGAMTVPEAIDTLAAWRDVVGEGLPTGARVLYAQSRAAEIVAELRGAGIDAYGLTNEGPSHQPGPDVRHGQVLDHLRAVADGALGAVVLTGIPEAMTPPGVAALVAELGRVAGMVVIFSEAPWWWRLRLGAVHADLSPGRPLDPDTWLLAFHGVAMVGSVRYDPSGHSYRVVVRAQQ